MKRFLPSFSPPHHSGGARVREVRENLLELDVSWKVLNGAEFENQSDQLIGGWALTAEMRKRDLTEVSWIKRKHFMLIHFNEPVMH